MCRNKTGEEAASANPFVVLNLLFAMACLNASLPLSYSNIFTPFNQCCTWLPFSTIRAVFHLPFTGLHHQQPVNEKCV